MKCDITCFTRIIRRYTTATARLWNIFDETLPQNGFVCIFKVNVFTDHRRDSQSFAFIILKPIIANNRRKRVSKKYRLQYSTIVFHFHFTFILVVFNEFFYWSYFSCFRFSENKILSNLYVWNMFKHFNKKDNSLVGWIFIKIIVIMCKLLKLSFIFNIFYSPVLIWIDVSFCVH